MCFNELQFPLLAPARCGRIFRHVLSYAWIILHTHVHQVSCCKEPTIWVLYGALSSHILPPELFLALDWVLTMTWTGKSKFARSQSAISTGPSPEVAYPTQETNQPRPQNPRWLLRTSTAMKALYSLLALLPYLCLMKSASTQFCPTSIWGHVSSMFVCAKYHVMPCYQLELLTKADSGWPDYNSFADLYWIVINSGMMSFPVLISDFPGKWRACCTQIVNWGLNTSPVFIWFSVFNPTNSGLTLPQSRANKP